MKRYEYCTADSVRPMREEEMNFLGKRGWRLFSATKYNGGWYYIFEKEIDEERAIL